MPTLISSRFLVLVGESLHMRRALATSRYVLLHTSVKCMSQVEPHHGSLTVSGIGLQTETEHRNRSKTNKVKPLGSPSENNKSKGKPFGINEKKKKAFRVVEKQQIESAPLAAKSFSELGLPHGLIERLEKEGFTVPTEVQSAAVPTILNNHDVIIQSYTGSGKTLAYLLSILSVVGPLRGKTPEGNGDDGESGKKLGIEAVIIAPSRELGMQRVREFEKVLGMDNKSGSAACGGCKLNQAGRCSQEK